MEELKNKMEQELLRNILPFWITNTIDTENGGFYGRIDNENAIDKLAPKGAILCARILWTFSSAYRMYKKDEYLKVAQHAYKYIREHFYDKKNSGLYMLLDYLGKPYDDRKFLYVQGFAIYGLSEYYRACGDIEALNLAITLFNTIEESCSDKINKGYFEAFSREWRELDNNVLGENHMDVKKSMNAHLHIMEGYTNLYRVYKNEKLEIKLRELIEICVKYIVNPQTYHLNAFFDEDWSLKSDSYTFGHDIETSWLLYESAEVLGDKELLEQCRVIAINMARVTLAEGVADDGSLYYEANSNGIMDFNREWWPQIEAVVGFINAYELTGEEKYLTAAKKAWEYIEINLVDKVKGEWFWGRKSDGSIMDKEKGGPWKCPYHNGRGSMEIVARAKNG